MHGVELQPGLGTHQIDQAGRARLIMHTKAWPLVDHHKIFLLRQYPVHLEPFRMTFINKL
ncbi:hypothetical protein D3C76_1114740 [compost metagenome]